MITVITLAYIAAGISLLSYVIVFTIKALRRMFR